MKDEHMLPETQQQESGVTRRCFLKTVAGAAAGIGVSQVVNPSLVKALEKGLKRHPVVWLQGQGCTGCSVSLLNSVDPGIADVLLKVISLQYHPTVMAGEGETAMENLFAIAKEYKGRFSLVVEGAIPTAAEGMYCVVGEYEHKEYTMVDLVKEVAPMAGSCLAV
ncbi:MAG: twin-arginine translocation signal domain-containing protein, partial [Desulfobacterales bacterium]|nr:twin-arginine translocation signal domain-containing protein [Desulfobacterales bacterium]